MNENWYAGQQDLLHREPTLVGVRVDVLGCRGTIIGHHPTDAFRVRVAFDSRDMRAGWWKLDEVWRVGSSR